MLENTGRKHRIAKVAAAALFALAAARADAADLEFLRELVSIPSASSDIPEVNRAVRAMKGYLEKRGVWCAVENHPGGNEILFAATRPGKEQDFCISVHLDVVPASVEGQYKMRDIDGRLTGRGVDDCKGRCVTVAETLAKLNGKASVGCIFGVDEEIGGALTTWMVEERGYRPRRMVIVADAGPNVVYYAQKGQCMVRLVAKGRAGHSSMPWNCDDSITRLARGYLKLRDAWDARHPPTEDKWWDVLTPTVVKSEGDAHNRIPGEVDMVLNLRSVDPGAKDELISLAREATGLDVELIRYSPPFNGDPCDPLIRGVRAAIAGAGGAEVALERLNAATDARCFVNCGVPIAIVGTRGGGEHGDAEWADPSSFDIMGAWMEKFLLDPEKYSQTP